MVEFCSYRRGACFFIARDGVAVCVRCGTIRQRPVFRECIAAPRRHATAAPASQLPVFLGDRLAAWLKRMRVTPETYQHWKRRLRLVWLLGEGCGCQRRQGALNRMDAAVRDGAAKLRAFLGW